MSNLYINREEKGTGGSIDASVIAEVVKELIIKHPEPPHSIEELYGLVDTCVRQMQRCTETGQLSLFRAWLIFLSVKAATGANSLHLLPLELPSPYFITDLELGKRKEAA